MLIRKLGSFSMAGAFALYGAQARAESGVPSCLDVEFVEVFAGAPGCEDVAYVVVQMVNASYLNGSDGYVMLGAEGANEVFVNLAEWTDGAGERVLIGTSNVERYFGVEPDVVLDRPFPLMPDSGSLEGCRLASYGSEGARRINACEGQAIHWLDWYTVELREPSPVNSRGEQGHWAGCPALGDAGEGGLPALCEQVTPEPTAPPQEPTAPPQEPTAPPEEPTAPPEAGASNPEPTTDPVAEPTDVPETPDETTNEDSLPEQPTDASAAPAEGATAPPDSGDEPGGPAQRGVASASTANGCDCNVADSRERTGLWALGFAALAVVFRRRGAQCRGTGKSEPWLRAFLLR